MLLGPLFPDYPNMLTSLKHSFRTPVVLKTRVLLTASLAYSLDCQLGSHYRGRGSNADVVVKISNRGL